MAQITNLPTDLLRTFVTVVELGGHSRAGAALGRSQPAISLQIKRLEEIVGAAILGQDGRKVAPTAYGEMLLGYAREMIRINDEAMSYFRRRDFSGVLRIGVPTDYSAEFLQTALADFNRNHREVALEIYCDLSKTLLRRLSADEIDIIVAIMSEPKMPYLSRSWVEEPVWAAAEDVVVDPARPVPLAAHLEGCEYRARMIRGLDAIGRHWRIVYTGPGIAGLQRAVLNGIGVTALTRATLLKGMRIVGPEEGLPSMEALRVGLFYKHPRLSGAGLELVSDLVAKLDGLGANGFRIGI